MPMKGKGVTRKTKSGRVTVQTTANSGTGRKSVKAKYRKTSTGRKK